MRPNESAGIGTGFTLIVDSGCLHGMSGDDRDAYVRGIGSVIAPGGALLIVAFTPGGSFGVPGISPDEVTRRFGEGWTAISSGPEAGSCRGRTALLVPAQRLTVGLKPSAASDPVTVAARNSSCGASGNCRQQSCSPPKAITPRVAWVSVGLRRTPT